MRDQIVELHPDQLPAARAVLRDAYGWDEARERFAEERLDRYLRAQPDGWFMLRIHAGGAAGWEIAAAGGCFVFSSIAFFGLVGVAPRFQGRGLGRALMEHLFEVAARRGARTLLLDASPAGEPLYASMGFRVIDETQVFARSAHGPTARASARVRRATAADCAEIAALDRAAYGGDRFQLIRTCLADGRAFVHEGGGFCIAQSTHVGPVVARTPQMAGELLDAALDLDFARGPEIYTRGTHHEMRSLLTERGFGYVRSLKHMHRGEARGPRPMVFGQQSLATG